MKSEIQKALENLRGKYIKQILSNLERDSILNPDIRKIVLDGINDYARDVFKELGYTTEE